MMIKHSEKESGTVFEGRSVVENRLGGEALPRSVQQPGPLFCNSPGGETVLVIEDPDSNSVLCQ